MRRNARVKEHQREWLRFQGAKKKTFAHRRTLTSARAATTSRRRVVGTLMVVASRPGVVVQSLRDRRRAQRHQPCLASVGPRMSNDASCESTCVRHSRPGVALSRCNFCTNFGSAQCTHRFLASY